MKLTHINKKINIRSNLKYFITASFLIFLLIMSCSILTGNQTIELDSHSNGKTIDIKCGKKLTIKLKGNATTGYTWALSDYDENLIKFIDVHYVPLQSKSEGTGGEWVTNFEVISPGESEITFIYKRPWEKNNSSMQKFYVTIKANKK